MAVLAAHPGLARRRLAAGRAAARRGRLQQLLGDPYPLATAIARSALARRESRGGQLRIDHPGIDHELDGVHLVLGADGQVRREAWR